MLKQLCALLSKCMNKVYSLSLLFFHVSLLSIFVTLRLTDVFSTTTSNVLLSEEQNGAAPRERHIPIILCTTFTSTDLVLKNSCNGAEVSASLVFFCFNLTCENISMDSRIFEMGGWKSTF